MSLRSSVVVAGSLPRDGGRYHLNCAVIVKRVDDKTRRGQLKATRRPLRDD